VPPAAKLNGGLNWLALGTDFGGGKRGAPVISTTTAGRIDKLICFFVCGD
jgi:hypothetical protein